MRFLASIFLAIATATAFAQSQDRSFEVPDTLDLQTSLSFALENNFDIQRAKQAIEEQNGLIIEVRAQALPDLSLNGQYIELDEGLSETFGGLVPPTTNRWSYSLDVRQTLYAGGGVRAALNAQRLIEEAALLELEAVINEALLQTRIGFYQALLAREQIQVQEESIALLEEQLKNAKDRFDAGVLSNFEVLRAEVDLANGRPGLITARNAFRVAIEELRQTLGFFVADPSQLTKAPEFVGDLSFSPQPYSLDSSLAAALEGRPELRRLERVSEARKEGVVIAKAGRRPEVSLIGSYEFNRPSSSSSFDDALEGWTAGVEVKVPIFDGLRTRGRIQQAKSQLELSKLDFRQTTLAIEVEVRRALSDLQEAEELAGASIKVVGQAEEALRLATARFSAGESTQLDVMQAQVALTQAKLNRAEAFFRYNVAEASVRKAIGLSD